MMFLLIRNVCDPPRKSAKFYGMRKSPGAMMKVNWSAALTQLRQLSPALHRAHSPWVGELDRDHIRLRRCGHRGGKYETAVAEAIAFPFRSRAWTVPVSYTHLTLPTKRIV